MKYELRTKNYRLNTSDEPQATCDEFALFWSFFANFCAFCAVFCTFCASLRLIIHLFRQLLKKAIVMALWTKAITCDKAGFKSRFCQEHQVGKNIISVNPVILSNFSSCFCAFLWLKNHFNPRLIKDLRSTKVYVRKNNLFMQNKANFQKVKLNVNEVLTKDYVQMDTWSIGTKQSQTNPNKAKLKKAKMNVTSILTKDYENKPPIRAPKKQSQTSKRQKPMQLLLPQRIMNNTALSASEKTNPNKPNSNPTCRGVASGEAGKNTISKDADQ